MIRKSIATLLALLFTFTLFAQKTKRVCGEYVYHVPVSQSLEDARYTAVERAKLQALANEFGTVISQSNSTVMTTENGKTDSRFFSLGGSEVKGEWIEDIGKPTIEEKFENGMFTIYCSICGRARETRNLAADFTAKVLRNGTEARFESTEFKDGDNMYIYFQSPVDGYVAVYLVDETPEAFCLLPYQADRDGQHSVSHGETYVFFSPEKAREEITLVDQYTLETGKPLENNQVYVIFSATPFTKAVDSAREKYVPRQLGYRDFLEWLAECRKNDPAMGVKVFNVSVRR